MHLNLLTLAFSGPTAHLEQTFLDDYYRDSLPHLRIVMPLGALFYAFLQSWINFLMPLHRIIPWLIRFAIVCPALLAGVGFRLPAVVQAADAADYLPPHRPRPAAASSG